jgi:acetyl/propionyl-CoA carboxylase alpha subunit
MSVRKTVLVDGAPRPVALDGRSDALTARVGDGDAFDLAVAKDGAAWRVTIGGRAIAATVVRDRDTVWIAIDGEIHRCTAVADDRSGGAAGGAHSPEVTAPMPGKVLAVRVEVGQAVAAGDPLVVLEAMKMETIVAADASARVREVRVAAGAMVEPGQVVVVLEYVE